MGQGVSYFSCAADAISTRRVTWVKSMSRFLFLDRSGYTASTAKHYKCLVRGEVGLLALTIAIVLKDAGVRST